MTNRSALRSLSALGREQEIQTYKLKGKAKNHDSNRKTPPAGWCEDFGNKPLTKRETLALGVLDCGRETPLAIVLDNGVAIIALRDEEGNGFGTFVRVFNQEQYYLQPEKAAK